VPGPPPPQASPASTFAAQVTRAKLLRTCGCLALLARRFSQSLGCEQWPRQWAFQDSRVLTVKSIHSEVSDTMTCLRRCRSRRRMTPLMRPSHVGTLGSQSRFSTTILVRERRGLGQFESNFPATGSSTREMAQCQCCCVAIILSLTQKRPICQFQTSESFLCNPQFVQKHTLLLSTTTAAWGVDYRTYSVSDLALACTGTGTGSGAATAFCFFSTAMHGFLSDSSCFS